ncbi:MAG: ThuA domain-containing protein [Bacteroidetes bacterium]|nr:ThuA domain-containing protein [Bacteroidota bacterium]
MKKWLTCLLFFGCFYVNAQSNAVLVLEATSQPTIQEKLNFYASQFNLTFQFSNKITTENINGKGAILLLDFDDNVLDIRQNNLILNFLNSGGGLMACGPSIKEKYRWNWLESILGVKRKKPIEIFSGEIITLKSIGQTELLPIWSLNNTQLTGINPAKNLTPVLMDFSGNNLAWTGKTDKKSKIFVTTFSPDTLNLDNQNFRMHFLGGIKSVLNAQNIAEKVELTLPDEIQFHTDTLLKTPARLKKLLMLPHEKLLLIGRNDSIFIYDINDAEIRNLGITHGIGEALGLSADPEFSVNQSLYAYFRDSSNAFFAKKLKLDLQLNWEDFQSSSTLPVFSSFFVKPDTSSLTHFSFPEYYFGKRIYLNSENSLSVDTYSENDELISTEPFVLNFPGENLISLAFSSFGVMYLAVDDWVKIIEYNKDGKFMQKPEFEYASIPQKNGQAKITLKVKNPDSQVKYKWEINGREFTGQNISVSQKRKSKLEVRLKAISLSGKVFSNNETLEIK